MKLEPPTSTPALTWDEPRVSVVVPMYNAFGTIEQCLAPLTRARRAGAVHEIIVVDDASTDESPSLVAAIAGVRLMRSPVQAGPAAARNQGALAAVGTHLWFVDADVVVADDAATVVHRELRHGAAAALVGSYDDVPRARNFLSQYKNLVHRYYHQSARRDASTFWAGCGVVERATFDRAGGFDAARYPHPSIEDIDLGYRIRDAGGRIALVRDLQGTHLKEWRLRNLLHTEILRRALPWTRLMLGRGQLTDDLNVARAERLRAGLAGTSVASLLVAAGGWLSPWVAVAALGAIAASSSGLFTFFAQRRGVGFAVGAVAFHQAYYLYASATFVYGLLEHRLAPRRSMRLGP